MGKEANAISSSKGSLEEDIIHSSGTTMKERFLFFRKDFREMKKL
jgi:hypothetical protein